MPDLWHAWHALELPPLRAYPCYTARIYMHQHRADHHNPHTSLALGGLP